MNAVRQQLVAKGLLVPTTQPEKREHDNTKAILARKQEDPRVRRAIEILSKHRGRK